MPFVRQTLLDSLGERGITATAVLPVRGARRKECRCVPRARPGGRGASVGGQRAAPGGGRGGGGGGGGRRGGGGGGGSVRDARAVIPSSPCTPDSRSP